jgi:2,3-dihydroxybenzoate decarboxylase
MHTLLQLGADRVMFAVDWPFEEISHAATWFDAVDLNEVDRLKVGRTNAACLFKLDIG